jgi:hypothetical protein
MTDALLIALLWGLFILGVTIAGLVDRLLYDLLKQWWESRKIPVLDEEMLEER